MEPLRVRGELDSLALIRDYIDKAAASAGLGKKESYRLRLAVDEIATNIVTYGYGPSGIQGEVVVQADLNNDNLIIVLEDTAPPFNPTRAEEPDDLDAPLEERSIGGLGIFLTVKGVDEFRYEHLDGRNRNIFIMKRPSASNG